MRGNANRLISLGVLLVIAALPTYLAAEPDCHAIVKGYAPVNGVNLYFEVKGCGAPVVLVHGLTLDSRMWESQFHALTRYFRVIRYDARGHGLSDGITGQYSSVADLDALLNYLGVDQPVHVVGLSRGADIALKYAIAHGERVRFVVAMDTSLSGWIGWFLPGHEFIYRFLGYQALVAAGDLEGALDGWRQDPLFGPANETPGVRTKLRKMIDQHLEQGAGGCFANSSSDTDPPARPSLYQITAPLMVTVGELDLDELYLIAENIRDEAINTAETQFFVVPNAGHLSNMENPEFVTGALLAFLMSN